MRLSGFRRALPLVFTVLHLVLVVFPSSHPFRRSIGVVDNHEYRSATYQEGDGIPMESLANPPLKPAQRIVLILDLPATMVSVLIGMILFPQNDAAWLCLSTAFVPLLWYCVGRWLDGLLGYIERLHLRRSVRQAFAIAAAGLLCISILGLTPVYHHRTSYSAWVFTGSIFWAALCFGIVFPSSARCVSREGEH